MLDIEYQGNLYATSCKKGQKCYWMDAESHMNIRGEKNCGE